MMAERWRLGAGRIPAAPGVYFFQNRAGRLLYIGKARDLRARLRQHEAAWRKIVQNPPGLPPAKFDRRYAALLTRVHHVRCLVVESELEALVLEDALIKKHWPRFNIRQKKFLSSRYLVMTGELLPRLKIVHHRAAARAQLPLFGPFRDSHAARRAQETVNLLFGLRDCPEAKPDRLCSSFDLGNCPGPCAGEISAERYRSRAQRAHRFLAGESPAVLGPLRRRMERESRDLRFERAAQTRDLVAFCERYHQRQVFFRRFQRETLRVREGDEEALIFDRGLPLGPLWKQRRRVLLNDLLLRDRADVILAYLHSRPEERSYTFGAQN